VIPFFLIYPQQQEQHHPHHRENLKTHNRLSVFELLRAYRPTDKAILMGASQGCERP
jgi:hypothetical protein